MVGPDTPSYLAVANSLIQEGHLRDQTSIPASSSVTLRGVVILHVALAKMGLGAEGRLVAISLLYFLLHVSAAYPLYKIARRVGLDGTAPVVALLAVHLGAFHVYRLQLLPYNDGFFNALSVWLSYLIVVALQGLPSRSALTVFGRAVSWTAMLGAIIGLSAVLVLFRGNVVVIIVAALLAAALSRRGRLAAWALAALSISVGTLMLFSSTLFLKTVVRLVFDGIVARLPSGALYLITDTVPETLFAPMSARASLIFAPFGLALVIVLVGGFRKREPGVMFIALTCAMAALALVVLPFKDLVFGHTRYLAYVFPFLYLLVLLPQKTRVIGYMFAASSSPRL